MEDAAEHSLIAALLVLSGSTWPTGPWRGRPAPPAPQRPYPRAKAAPQRLRGAAPPAAAAAPSATPTEGQTPRLMAALADAMEIANAKMAMADAMEIAHQEAALLCAQTNQEAVSLSARLAAAAAPRRHAQGPTQPYTNTDGSLGTRSVGTHPY